MCGTTMTTKYGSWEAGLPPITPGNYYLKEILLGATPHPKGINGEKLLKAKRKKKPGIPT